MSKTIDSIIEKRIKEILNKESLSEEDLKFLILYRHMTKESPIEKLLKEAKKIISILNSDKGAD